MNNKNKAKAIRNFSPEIKWESDVPKKAPKIVNGAINNNAASKYIQ